MIQSIGSWTVTNYASYRKKYKQKWNGYIGIGQTVSRHPDFNFGWVGRVVSHHPDYYPGWVGQGCLATQTSILGELVKRCLATQTSILGELITQCLATQTSILGRRYVMYTLLWRPKLAGGSAQRVSVCRISLCLLLRCWPTSAGWTLDGGAHGEGARQSGE